MQDVAPAAPQVSTRVPTPPSTVAVKAEIVAPTEPINLTIAAPTDWIASLITPVAIAVLGLWISVLTQRSMKRSSVAALRHAWSGDFQKACTDFVSSTTHLHFKLVAHRNYLRLPESNEQLVKMETAHASIRMLLPPSENYTTELIKIMDQTYGALIKGSPMSPKSARYHLTNFVSKAQEVRMIIWDQIGNDLSVPK